ncbi:AP-3 complex subunit mu-2 [Plutella xylostella]|uniref:AP-3 complex subunit mu-2 n=1 Tax=Plutella xylostella TaxID=51655 RepID=A0ABQ7QH84_PLUXY|nr:AP-3 complex subunit mu-2 [Plutella xylostella]
MIHSLFIINSAGDVFLEKHWRSVIPRSVCDYYLEAQRASPNDVPPVLAAPHHYLISIQRGGVALVAVCKQEVAPLFVIEFLHRVVDTFQVRKIKEFNFG